MPCSCRVTCWAVNDASWQRMVPTILCICVQKWEKKRRCARLFAQRKRKHRCETSSGTVVKWISGWLEVVSIICQVNWKERCWAGGAEEVESWGSRWIMHYTLNVCDETNSFSSLFHAYASLQFRNKDKVILKSSQEVNSQYKNLNNMALCSQIRTSLLFLVTVIGHYEVWNSVVTASCNGGALLG